MARGLSFKEMAARLERWAAVGIPYALVEAGLKALEKDAQETRSRIRSRSGRLAATVRVVRPSSRRAGRTGEVRLALAAGSRSSDPKKAVPYAGIIQYGGRTGPHKIGARGGKRLKFPDGGFATEVEHKGATFRAQTYAKVDDDRLQASLPPAIVRAFYEDKILMSTGVPLPRPAGA